MRGIECNVHLTDTMSWASVVKRNTPATNQNATNATTSPAIKTSATITVPETFAHDLFTASFDRNRECMAEFEKEEQSQCRPTYIGLKRPDAPTVFPIFRTTDEEWGWMRMEDAIETMRIPKKSLKSACRNGALNTTGSFQSAAILKLS